MKKILLFITQADMGGAQKVVFELARHAANDNDVTVFTGKGKYLNKWISDLNMNIKVFQYEKFEREVNVLHDIICFLKLVKLIKKERFDIIHCHSAKAGAIGRLAAFICGVKRIMYTVHGFGSSINSRQSKVKNTIYSIIEYLLSFITTNIVVVSKEDFLIARKIRIKKEKLKIIYNGVEVNHLNKTERVNNSVSIIITTARVFEQKDWMSTVQVLKKLKNMRIKFKFYWLGDGPQFRKFEKEIKVNGLSNQVKLLGNVDNVYKFLRRADIFMLLSKWEGLPVSIIEALFMGLPVIASNVGGNGELVYDGINGYLINDNNDSAYICNKIIEIINNEDKKEKMGTFSKMIAKRSFSLSIMIKKYLSLYNA